MKNIPEIFSLRKIISHRDRAAKNICKHGFLLDEIEERLKDRLDDISGEFENVLAIGKMSVDFQSNLRNARGSKLIIQQDFTSMMPCNIVADTEKIPFASKSFNLIYSNSILHLVNDLPGVLAQIRNALKKDGVFVGSMFGGETLYELRKIMIAVESEIYGGVSPRISPFVDVKTLGSLVQRAGFDNLITDCDPIKISYDSVLDIMHDLRGMGESNAMAKSGRPLTRNMLQRIDDMYKEKFSDGDGGIMVTFEVINITGLATNSNE